MKKTTIELNFFGKLCLYVGIAAMMLSIVCGLAFGVPRAVSAAAEYRMEQIKEQQKQERIEKIKDTVFFWKD